jgi:hypothetical protein
LFGGVDKAPGVLDVPYPEGRCAGIGQEIE